MEWRVDVRRGDFLHALQRLHAALRLAGLGGLGAKAFDVGMDVRDLALLLGILGLLVGQARRAQAFERRVVAAVQRELLLFEVRDADR